MKILHFADLHLGVESYGHIDPATGISSRLLDFLAALDHGLKAAGATTTVVSDQAAEMLYRASRGTFRLAARLSRAALRIAQEHGQTFLDEPMVQLALDQLAVA